MSLPDPKDFDPPPYDIEAEEPDVPEEPGGDCGGP